MAQDIYETLKKITYDNLKQFVEDINRNFAIIQNSPLYKGVPGEPGEPGDPGLRGARGSRFFFVNTTEFIKQFPGELNNGSNIDLDFINSKLQKFEEKNKLLKALGATEFVDGDIIVLTNSIMLQYVMIEDVFKDTGIAFNQQSNLLSSIETKIEEYVKYYVDNNQSLMNLQNIFERYLTYAKTYATVNNIKLSNILTDGSVYMPYFAGITDNQGVELTNHKYFGFADKEFPEGNDGTIVFGSMKRFARLMLDTLSVVEKDTYTADYAPGVDNIPSVIFLQDTTNAGIMFGRKKAANLKRFANIFKDADDNLIIKSDMGKLLTDYSQIVLSRNSLTYEKTVFFGDDLTVKKDFINTGNFDTVFMRTGEFIHDAANYGPTNLLEGSQEELNTASQSREKIMEVGYTSGTDNDTIGKGCEYRNLNETIIFPWFVSNVLVTDENGVILKTYAIEKSDISTWEKSVSSDNLDDCPWTGTSKTDFHVLTSNYLVAVIKKINAIQQYVKANYWRKDQFARVKGSGADIPSLFLNNELAVNGDVQLGPNESQDKVYFKSTLSTNSLMVGSDAGTLILRSAQITLPKFTDIVVTTDVSGNIVTTYKIEKAPIGNIGSWTGTDVTENHILTSNYLVATINFINSNVSNLNNRVDATNQDLNDFKGETNDNLNQLDDNLNNFKDETQNNLQNLEDETNKNLEDLENKTNENLQNYKNEAAQNLQDMEDKLQQNLQDLQDKVSGEYLTKNDIQNGSYSANFNNLTVGDNITFENHPNIVLVTDAAGRIIDTYSIEKLPVSDIYSWSGTDAPENHVLTSNYLVALASKVKELANSLSSLGSAAPNSHTHKLADIEDLNDSWENLLKSAPSIPSIPDITIVNGTAVSGQYISGIIASGHEITITRANLPEGGGSSGGSSSGGGGGPVSLSDITDLNDSWENLLKSAPNIPSIPGINIINGEVVSGQYISGITATGHSVTVTRANLPTSSGGSYNGPTIWVGSLTEYNAISPRDPNTLYFVTDGVEYTPKLPSNVAYTDKPNDWTEYQDFKAGAGNSGS